MSHEFDDKSILITGGTGSFGKAFLDHVTQNAQPKRVVVFSRDELKQFDMKSKYSSNKNVRWFIGDIRDIDRLKLALRNIDYVVHAAALKQVDTGEYNPTEFIKTNILGSQNVIEASMYNNVKKVIALSTDKASSPINLYGATKLTADKLFTAANNYGYSQGTIFSVVRYGNVVGSRGSVLPYFINLANSNQPFPITDKRMTRFFITLSEACNFVSKSFTLMMGGEVFVPIIPSLRIIDLIHAIKKDAKIVDIGIRPGEKLHEEMISSDDSRRTTKFQDRYIVSPVVADWGYKGILGEKVDEGFSYRSDNNSEFIEGSQIYDLLEKASIDLGKP